MAEQVVIHAPADVAPKDSKGQSVLKPIKRKETDVTRRGLLISAGAIFAAILLAIGMRLTGGTPLVMRVLFAVLLAPPLVWVGYVITRDSELEPYRGRELWSRVGIVSILFAALWLVYAWAPAYVMDLDRASEMSLLVSGITLVVMMCLGALAAMVAFELEFPGGLTIAGVYLSATLALALIGAVQLATP